MFWSHGSSRLPPGCRLSQFSIAEAAMRNSALSVFRNRTSHLCNSNQIKQPAGGCSCAHMLQETRPLECKTKLLAWVGIEDY